MATVTPNYSWPVPTSTDLVKDGATAIEALGDAIDATVFGLPAPGMVKLTTVSFSGVASQSFNDVFSATYDNYKILSIITATASDIDLIFRLRVSGADDSTSNYDYASIFYGNSTSNGRSAAQTSFDLCLTGSQRLFQHEITLFNPQLAEQTRFISSGAEANVANTVDYTTQLNGKFRATTQFTGFSLVNTLSTFTGKVFIYGFNQ